MAMTRSDFGVWQAQGDSSWEGQYYLFRVQVFAPSTQRIETNEVTDPYSLSLAVNSTRSQFINLQKESWKPEGWDGIEKSPLAAPEDISIYELHVRDFSIWDESVPESSRGTYAAFSATGSDGVTHLQALRHSGLTHIHLLPVFDIATINERKEERLEPDRATLASFAADSEEQQKLVTNLANQDGFNWGYDPFHYTVPEGSYAQNAEGGQRILEFRHMIQALSDMGFRVVMDVVYNHTNASGQNEKSVLDRIVPGYYHRLNADGGVEKSTCCENTASEHAMMEKLMVDSLLIWAKEYKIDAFRFDLMGHHMVSNMQHVRDALAALTPEQDGVDGSSIYLYGEGWNFGEVANNQRGVNATQLNLKGEGIGTFSDRLRDAVRGGGPFDDGAQLKRQGFANGLFYDPNDLEQGNQWDTLRSLSDQIRVGLAGNLADFTLTNGWDQMVTGAQVDYNGQPAGYTADPQEVITYISKHDNQTLYDINIYGAPLSTSMEDRVRLQMVGLSLVALGQGVPFFHAGSDFLRSKSLDRDSYNSGDWFNVLDFSMEDNNFGVGLPVEEKNGSNWSLMAPLLANPDLKPEPGDIQSAAWRFQELLAIRYSSPLFRMETAEDIHSRLSFHNTGSQQVPGLIAMGLTDRFERDLDPENDRIMVIFNANDEAQEIHLPEFVSASFVLHPILAESVDPVVRTASFNAGTFAVPARTTAVFLEPQGHFTLGQRYVAHIATSDAWQSRIILDNATSETACITMKLFGEGATLKHQEFRLNPQERREFMATEGDAASFTVDQDGLVVRSSFFSNVGAGLAEFICDGQTYETLHFTFPHYASDLMGWRGLALMNFAPMNQEISLRSYDASGGIIGETSWTMAAFERRVGLLNELFPDWNAAAIARITVQGTQELSGISLSGTEDVIRLLYAPAVGEPLAGTVFASHLASDLNAWQNLIILDNVSDEPLEATVTFIAGDQEMSQTLTIAANASVIQAVNAEPFLAEMAKVTCASNGLIARQAFLNLQAGGGGTAEFLLSQDAAHRLALNFPPLDGSDPHQIGLTWRGLAIGNLADVSVMATFHAMGAEGILHSVEATIPARHRWVGFLEDLFDGVDPQSVHRVVVEGDGLMGGLNISGQGSTRLLFTPAVPLP
jgi:pullulanase-type alpha-1,6-glucosidase